MFSIYILERDQYFIQALMHLLTNVRKRLIYLQYKWKDVGDKLDNKGLLS